MKIRFVLLAASYLLIGIIGFYLGNSFGVRSQLDRSLAAFSNQLRSLYGMLSSSETQKTSSYVFSMIQEMDEVQTKNKLIPFLHPRYLSASFGWTDSQKASYEANHQFIAQMNAEQGAAANP